MTQVEWNNPENPGLGFKFLYLTDEVYTGLAPGTVNATKVLEESGEVKWVLDDIIGTEHGIGVENLRGSGMIAGETSRAYTETFTLSYVTGRSVGIGAYLCRLGQRTIQMKVPCLPPYSSTPSRALARPLTRVLPGGGHRVWGWVGCRCPRYVSPSSHADVYITPPSTVRPSSYPPGRTPPHPR